MKATLLALLAAAAVYISSGCGVYQPPGRVWEWDCDRACAYIYDSCDLLLVDTSNRTITRVGCVVICQGLSKPGMTSCVSAKACDIHAIVSCF